MYNRREVLKVSGGVVSTGILGPRTVGTVSADEKGKKLGSARFIEAFIEHKGAPDWPLDHTDDFPQYRINKDDREVLLTPFSSDSMVNMVQHSNIIISENARLFTGVGTLLFDELTNPRIDGTRALIVEHDYENPQISIALDDGRAKIHSNETQAVVDESLNEQVTFAPRPVTILKRSSKVIEDRSKTGDGTIKVPEMASGTRDVEIVPVVRVFNHGMVDFYEYGGEM